jgi:DNA gyrase subunit A
VRLVIEVRRDAEAEIVLNQLYQYSPLQSTFSLNFLALVDGKPCQLSFKAMLEEFLRHRVSVIRRRTQFLLSKARSRKHTVEGLLLAHANIDEVIRVIRSSKTQQEAKTRLMKIECPAAMLKKALGEEGFAVFAEERGAAENYTLTPVQADAILRMTLGQLVNLEQERLRDEHQKLLADIAEFNRILSDEKNILKIIRDDLGDLKKKFSDPRRTEISGEEIGHVDMEDLITEETMVVSISHNGYIKRTPASVYRAQRRGGKGLKGAKAEDQDPIEHLFVASTHAYLLFFTNRGRVHWQKVYDLPQLSRESRGRAVVNLLNLAEGEKIADCRAIRDFNMPGHFLMMATAGGLVKKTALEAYSRPRQGGIIALLVAGDQLVGMVVAEPEATLLTACANGYGKRTLFGAPATAEEGEAEDASSTGRYRTQKRGGKGVRDIKTTERNGPVIGITRVTDDDEVIMMTRRGKLQRIAASDISVIGRNTQGVRIMLLDDDDNLVAAVRVPRDENPNGNGDPDGPQAGPEAVAEAELAPQSPPQAEADNVAGPPADEAADQD